MPRRESSTATPRQDILASFNEAPLDFQPIGQSILTPIQVMKDRGNFGRIPLAALLSRADVKRKPRGGYNRSDWKYEDDSYSCQPYGHEEPANDSDRAEYEDMLDYEVVLGRRGRDIVVREQEFRYVSLLHNETTWPLSGTTGHTANNTWGSSSGTPIDDWHQSVRGIRARCGMTPNCLQVSWQAVWDLSRNPQILDRLKYTSEPEGVLPLATIARAMGVQRLLCPADGTVYNSAKEGQAESLAEIWTKTYAFACVVNTSRDMSAPCIGRTFHNDKDGGLLYVDQYREEGVESDIYRVKQKTHEKVIFPEAGYLIKGVG